MRTMDEYRQILIHKENGFNQSEIARLTNIPRCTVRDCIKKFKNVKQLEKANVKTTNNKIKFLFQIKNPKSKSDKKLAKTYAYLLGVYLGDGCISLQDKKKGVYRMRIACDAKYPNLIEQITNALKILMPTNKIGFVNSYYKGNLSCVYISCYSKHWPDIFSFFKPGVKHTYSIILEDWQKQIIKNYPIDFLMGLYQTDGSRFYNRFAKRIEYNFTQRSTDIKNLFCWVCDLLDVKYAAYWRPSSNTYTVNIVKKNEVAKLEKLLQPKT